MMELTCEDPFIHESLSEEQVHVHDPFEEFEKQVSSPPPGKRRQTLCLPAEIQEPLLEEQVHVHDPFQELGNQFSDPPPRKRRQKVSKYDTGYPGPLSDVTYRNQFSLPDNEIVKQCFQQDDSTEPPIAEKSAGTYEEDCTMQYPQLEEVYIQEDEAAYTFTPDPTTFDDSNKLYIGASISNMHAICLLMTWFGAFPGMSKESFSYLLNMLHTYILPEGNILPTSYMSALKLLQPHLSPLKEFHACVNDCIIFRDCSGGNYSDLDQCPQCGEDRYKENGKSPRKMFKHMPIETRIRRLFANRATSELLQSHRKSQTTQVSTIHESPAWSEWYSSNGFFGGDNRAIALGLCADGLNPFAKEKNSYSMWPLFLFVLNLPAQIWKKPSSMLLTGIVPGPGEPKNLDPYVDIIVDEIMHLNSLILYDAYHEERFKLKANVVLQVFDYPGQNKMLKCVGAGGYSGCCYCCTVGEYSPQLQKMVYLNHRAFLPQVDLLRWSHEGFPQVTVLAVPEPKTQAYVDCANGSHSAARNNAEKTKISRKTGCKGPYSLRRLPYHDRYLSTPVEPMHCLKNVAEHVIFLLNGKNDSVKVRREEQIRKRFKATWVNVGNEKSPLPDAPFRLKAHEHSIADSRLVSIKVPHGTDWRCQKLFGKSVTIHMKSVHWKHVLASGILKYCIRGLLGQEQRHTLFELCDVISIMTSEVVDTQVLDSTEYRVHKVLSLVERDFPVSLNVISLHLLHHLPMYIRQFGPVHGFWMYPMERLNSWISRRVLNRRFPESTVMASYRMFELSSSLQLFASHDKQSSALDITEVYDSSELDVLVNKGTDFVLNQKQTMEVYKHYKLTEPDTLSDMLASQYKQEKMMSKDQRSFPQFTVWLHLKEQATTLTSPFVDITNVVIHFPVYSLRDKFGRNIKLSKRPDNSSSVFCSSYVYLIPDSNILTRTHKMDDTPVFGCIQMVFKHKFNLKVNTLVLVHWFKGFTRDPESGLYSVDMESHDSSLCSVVSVADVSRPLIHAIDQEEPNKLWLLNFHS